MHNHVHMQYAFYGKLRRLCSNKATLTLVFHTARHRRGQQLVPDRGSFQRRIVIFLKSVKRNIAGDTEKEECSSLSTHTLQREYTNSIKAR